MGMRYYASATPGTGGRLKAAPEDFRVVERPGLAVEPLHAPPGDYGYLVVEVTATGRDSHAVLDELATAMGIHPGRVSVAGTKDANAVTTQWLTIRDGDPVDLPSLEGVELEPIGRLGRQLEFGDHAGNAFEVVVRDVSHPERVDAISDELCDDGQLVVPNFFGHQRFGTRRAITHVVGRRLVAGDVEGAVMTYLTEGGPHEPERTQTARRSIAAALDDGDTTAALAATPGYLTFERWMLEALDEAGPTAFDAAMQALPWSLQRLFVHAVQSHLFNELVSERLRRGFGLTEPLVGDTICFFDDHGRIDPDRAQPVTDSRRTAAHRHCARGRATVVAPLIGPATPAFDGEVGACYRTVLEGTGLERDDFADIPGIEATGTWRSIAVTPSLSIEREPLTVSFELPPGAYATVVLREYLKAGPDAYG